MTTPSNDPPAPRRLFRTATNLNLNFLDSDHTSSTSGPSENEDQSSFPDIDTDLDDPTPLLLPSKSNFPAPLDSLGQILGGVTDLILLNTNQSINFSGRRKIVMPVLDLNGKRLLSLVHSPRQLIGCRGQPNSFTRVIDPSGHVLISHLENIQENVLTTSRSITVHSGQKTLGIVTISGVIHSRVMVKKVGGDPLCRIDQLNGMYIFVDHNETQVATLQKVQGSLPLHFSGDLDIQTKGLLLLTSFVFFLNNFDWTVGGSGVKREFFVFFCSVFILLLVMFIIIVLAIYLTQDET